MNTPKPIGGSEPVLGVDVSKDQLDAALQRGTGEKFAEREFPNTKKGVAAMLAWARKEAGQRCAICLEPSGAYEEEACEGAHKRGHPVLLANAFRTANFRKASGARNKTDRVDARLLCGYARQAEVHPWLPPSPERRSLCEQVKWRGYQVVEKTRLQNWGSIRRDPDVKRRRKKRIADIDKEIDRSEQKIKGLLAKPEFAKNADLLLAIPGIGIVFVSTVLACVDVSRFKNARQFCAHAGATPCRTQSGTSTDRTHVSRAGNKLLRSAAFLCALSASVHNPEVKEFADRLRKRRPDLSPKQVIFACANKLLRIVFGVLKRGTPYQERHTGAAEAATGEAAPKAEAQAPAKPVVSTRKARPAAPARKARAEDGEVAGRICTVEMEVVKGLPPMRMKMVTG